jgi:hypothetical protein
MTAGRGWRKGRQRRRHPGDFTDKTGLTDDAEFG